MGHAEANAKTIEAAVAAAAAQLGLRPDQVEVEVLEEAIPSTFGVIGRPARVRVTARPAADRVQPTPAAVTAGGSASQPAATALTGSTELSSRPQAPREPQATHRREPQAPLPEATEADTELAGDFLEGLLDALDLDGDLTTWMDDYGGHVDLEGEQLDVLVGPDGETLQALQELTRLAVLRRAKHRVRIVIDVNGFRRRQREDLTATVRTAAERVVETREKEELWPMSAADRKVVHDVVAALDGARTESLGEEPNRRVVILPA